MTFARVMVCRGMDEHGPLYATRAGVSTETFAGRLANGVENRRVDSLCDG